MIGRMGRDPKYKDLYEAIQAMQEHDTLIWTLPPNVKGDRKSQSEFTSLLHRYARGIRARSFVDMKTRMVFVVRLRDVTQARIAA